MTASVILPPLLKTSLVNLGGNRKMQELMKKIIYAIAALALIFTGCAKELDNSTKDNFSKVRLHVKVADQLTKVSADNDGRYHWQAGDKISVLNNAGKAFEFETEEGGNDVDFGGTISTGTLGSYAMYPACEDNEATGNDILFNIPNEITWVQDATIMPMLGKISGDKAIFKSVGGVLKLVCYNIPSGAEQLIFTATNKVISGPFSIDGSDDTPVLETEDGSGGSEQEIWINFKDNYNTNMVFYIPLPTGTIDGFSVSIIDGSANVLYSNDKTASRNLVVARNQMIIAPALNCSAFADVVLSNEDITSHFPDEYSTAGTETINGLVWSYFDIAHYSSPGLQFRKNSGYLGLPDFGKDIASVIVEGVYNGSKGAFPTTSKIQFYADLDDEDPLVEIDGTGKAGDDYTLIVPAGNSTGYIMATGAMQITSLTVTFSSLSPSAPSITSAEDPIVISVASGDVNSASTSITYSTSLGDGLGVSIASHSDWITPTLTGTGPYTLAVSANKKVTAGDREDGFVTLRASGVTKTITVTQPSAYVPDPELTVVPGNGHFTATWTKHANATGYVIYLGDPENGGTNISDDAGLTYDSGTNEYTLTKSVVNDDYDLYVSATPAANYVGQEGYSHESFTCSATSYTVTIIQPASGGSFTANGESVTFTASQGDVIALEATPESSSYKFVSWTVTGASPASTTNASTTFTMPAANVTVTASFAAKEWVKVIDASTLAAGQQIMLVATVSGSSTSANNGTFAANGSISSNVMGKVSATITSNKLTSYTGAQIFTLGKSGSYWTLSNGSYLLGVTAVKKIAWGSGTTTWTISITDGVATIESTGAGLGKIKYNRDSPRFTTYTGDFTASMAGPMIFRYE